MLDAFPPDLQEFVRQKIAAGVFQSEDEFAVEAASLYREMDRRRTALKNKLASATEELDRGEGIELTTDEAIHAFFAGISAEGARRLADEAAAP